MPEAHGPTLLRSAPYFPVVDVGQSAVYYERVLGFHCQYRAGDPPIYRSFTLSMMLVAVKSANGVTGLSGVLLVSSIGVIRIPVEERQLATRFGTRWNEYCARTNALVPSRPR